MLAYLAPQCDSWLTTLFENTIFRREGGFGRYSKQLPEHWTDGRVIIQQVFAPHKLTQRPEEKAAEEQTEDHQGLYTFYTWRWQRACARKDLELKRCRGVEKACHISIRVKRGWEPKRAEETSQHDARGWHRICWLAGWPQPKSKLENA